MAGEQAAAAAAGPVRSRTSTAIAARSSPAAPRQLACAYVCMRTPTLSPLGTTPLNTGALERRRGSRAHAVGHRLRGRAAAPPLALA